MDVSELHPDRVAVVFNGDYEVTSAKTGEIRTLVIRTQDLRSKFCPGERILKILTGTNREDFNDWEGFAFVTDRGIQVWKAKRGDEKRSLHDYLAQILWGIEVDGEESPWFKAGYRVESNYRCIICNRPLTNDESMKTGIGSICAGRRKPNKRPVMKSEGKEDGESTREDSP